MVCAGEELNRMQASAAQALIYNARCVRTSHFTSGDKTARRVLSLVILICVSCTSTPLKMEDTGRANYKEEQVSWMEQELRT